jgi:hypothetical protein
VLAAPLFDTKLSPGFHLLTQSLQNVNVTSVHAKAAPVVWAHTNAMLARALASTTPGSSTSSNSNTK